MQPGAWHEGLQPTRNTYEVPPGPHRDVPAPIDVHVRIVFERDGEQWFTGRALEWTSELVRVEVHDPHHRLHPSVAWVAPGDVRRRTEPLMALRTLALIGSSPRLP